MYNHFPTPRPERWLGAPRRAGSVVVCCEAGCDDETPADTDNEGESEMDNEEEEPEDEDPEEEEPEEEEEEKE